MPLYDYKCRACGHAFEIHQSFSDDPLTVCPECEGELRKVFSPVGISFKGSGFYKTDSRGSNGSGSTKESTSSGSSSNGTSTSTESGGSTKPASDSSGSGGSGSGGSGSGGSGSGGSGSGSSTPGSPKSESAA